MSYLEKSTVDDSIKILQALSDRCAQMGGRLAKHLNAELQLHHFAYVIDFFIDYSQNYSVNDFIYARQIQALVAKQDFLDLGIDKKQVAFDKFLVSEEMCRSTNARFENLSFSKDVNAIHYEASRKIRRILGDVPSIDSLDLSFGPGATTSTKSRDANHRVKLSSRLECSANLIPIVGEVLNTLPMMKAHLLSPEGSNRVIVATGKLNFVPKNCKTDRSIVVEPILNGLLQKGIGTYMKRRLAFAGQSTTDQTRNQRLAYKGSIDGLLSTVDLSMASDCVSRGLVWSLLPYEWASLLDCARTPEVTYLGKTYYLEKFSSMGNAYTFELETLIFYALTWATCSYLGLSTDEISVYGDDIICPTAAYDLLEQVLEESGFKFNKLKSYSTGPFRESCGADFLHGIDIRPFYLKNLIDARTLFLAHNYFIRNAEPALAKCCVEYIPVHIRLYGPDGYGDGHLIGDYHLRSNRKMKRDGFEGGVFDTYELKPIKYVKLLPGDFIFPCYSIYVKGSIFGTAADGETIRGTSGYKKISIYTLASSRIFESKTTKQSVNLPHLEGSNVSKQMHPRMRVYNWDSTQWTQASNPTGSRSHSVFM